MKAYYLMKNKMRFKLMILVMKVVLKLIKINSQGVIK